MENRWMVMSLFAVGVIVLVVSGIVVFNRVPSFPPAENTAWGNAAALGNGEIRTYATVEPSGQPTAIGIFFGANALTGLPSEGSDGHWTSTGEYEGSPISIPCCGYEVVLDLPDSVATTDFGHVLVNYNPEGHIPPGIYDVPHFDFHFYTTTVEERTAIGTGICAVSEPEPFPAPVDCETFEAGMRPLPSDQQPNDYIFVGAVEPAMGNHLIDPLSPEFPDAPGYDPEVGFTHTWIWGTYDGEITFFEPMITRAFLERQDEEVCSAIKMPQALPEAGWYPTEYCIRYLEDQDAYAISLERFESFEASVAAN